MSSALVQEVVFKITISKKKHISMSTKKSYGNKKCAQKLRAVAFLWGEGVRGVPSPQSKF